MPNDYRYNKYDFCGGVCYLHARPIGSSKYEGEERSMPEEIFYRIRDIGSAYGIGFGIELSKGESEVVIPFRHIELLIDGMEFLCELLNDEFLVNHIYGIIKIAKLVLAQPSHLELLIVGDSEF